MFQTILTVKNPQGIHLNPASKLVKLCLEYDHLDITFSKEGDTHQVVSGTSVMGLLSLELSTNSQVKVTMKEEDKTVLAKIEELIS